MLCNQNNILNIFYEYFKIKKCYHENKSEIVSELDS